MSLDRDAHVRWWESAIRARAAAGCAESLARVRERSHHCYLVTRAVRWLRGSRRCGVVLAEVIGGGFEQPDAIGWRLAGSHSILVECKTSRSDFRRGLKKPHRVHGWLGMGQERWYLAPAGLLRPEEIPDGWGLLEDHGRLLRTVVKPPKLSRIDPDVIRREVPLLFAAARKAELGLPLDRWHT